MQDGLRSQSSGAVSDATASAKLAVTSPEASGGNQNGLPLNAEGDTLSRSLSSVFKQTQCVFQQVQPFLLRQHLLDRFGCYAFFQTFLPALSLSFVLDLLQVSVATRFL